MKPRRSQIALLTGVVATCLAIATPAAAQEVALTVGRLLGDDVGDDGGGGLLSTDFADANLFGVRAGVGLLLVDVEASLLTGKSGLFEDTEHATDARFTYLEGAAVVRLFPGPVAPFLAAGLGLHRIALDGPDHTTLGYNVGVGLKVALGAVGVRADLRDHITPLDVEDLGPELAEALGEDGSTTLHNFELSLGLIVRF